MQSSRCLFVQKSAVTAENTVNVQHHTLCLCQNPRRGPLVERSSADMYQIQATGTFSRDDEATHCHTQGTQATGEHSNQDSASTRHSGRGCKKLVGKQAEEEYGSSSQPFQASLSCRLSHSSQYTTTCALTACALCVPEMPT